MLEVSHVSKHFGGIKAVRDVSFSLAPGQFLACVGPNAAGKTTLLNLVSGWNIPDEGSVKINGQEVHSFTPEVFASHGVVRTFQKVRLFRKQTVLDNLLFASRWRSEETLIAAMFRKRWLRRQKHESDRAKKILGDLGIGDLCYRPAESLSGGQQRLVELAIAGMREPKILVLDEPTANLSHESRKKIASFLLKKKQAGICCIFVEHDLSFVHEVADRVLVLSRGTPFGFEEVSTGSTPKLIGKAYSVTASPESKPQLNFDGVSRNGKKRRFRSKRQQSSNDVSVIEVSTTNSIKPNRGINWHKRILDWRSATDRFSTIRTSAKTKSDFAPLTIRSLSVDYGNGPVIEGIDFDINPGEIVALIGGNGAGKSTTIRAILGLVRYRGSIGLGEKSLTSVPPYAIRRLGLSYVAQHRKVFPSLTVLENLIVGSDGIQEAPPARVQPALRTFPELREVLNAPAGNLSGGQQQMVAIARVILQRPRMLLLDEPSAGLSEPVWRRSVEVFTELAKLGVPILIVEHRPLALKDILSRAYLIERGRLLSV